jgi:hypothetical protein
MDVRMQGVCPCDELANMYDIEVRCGSVVTNTSNVFE